MSRTRNLGGTWPDEPLAWRIMHIVELGKTFDMVAVSFCGFAECSDYSSMNLGTTI